MSLWPDHQPSSHMLGTYLQDHIIKKQNIASWNLSLSEGNTVTMHLLSQHTCFDRVVQGHLSQVYSTGEMDMKVT